MHAEGRPLVSVQLVSCLPLFLPPSRVPCRMVFAWGVEACDESKPRPLPPIDCTKEGFVGSGNLVVENNHLPLIKHVLSMAFL